MMAYHPVVFEGSPSVIPDEDATGGLAFSKGAFPVASASGGDTA